MRKIKHKQRSGFKEDVILSETSPFAYAESYKTLRTNLNFASRNGKVKKIMLTSALPSESKSSVSINLAITLAEKGAKVVLVDCDLRKSNVRRYLHLGSKDHKGVSDIISGSATLEDCLCRVVTRNIWAVPSGSIPPNPAELLDDEGMGTLLNQLAEQFDYVLCDTAPVNVVSDGLNVSRHCDGVVLVVRQNFATKDEIRRAKQLIEGVGSKLIGSILVRYEDKKNKAASSYDYYGSYAYEYGYTNEDHE